MKLELTLLPLQRKNFLNARMIFKTLIILERLLVVEMIIGFRSKVLVILMKCVLQISDSLLSSETTQSFSEIIILLEKFPFSEKYDLIVHQNFYCWVEVLDLPLKKSSSQVFLNNFV